MENYQTDRCLRINYFAHLHSIVRKNTQCTYLEENEIDNLQLPKACLIKFNGDGSVNFYCNKELLILRMENVTTCSDDKPYFWTVKLRENIDNITFTHDDMESVLMISLRQPEIDITIDFGTNKSEMYSLSCALKLLNNDLSFDKNLDLPATRLDCNNFALSVIDTRIMQLNKLTDLDLSNNNLVELPEAFGSAFANLENLSLAGNKIGSQKSQNWKWMSEIKLQSSLKSLDLSDNMISELPIELCQFDKLKKLKLQKNHLKDLPENVGALSNLRSLILTGNEFGHNGITSWAWMRSENLQKYLECLDLGYNDIKKVPIELKNFQTLYRLSLSGNKIGILPFWLADTNLLQLDVSENLLTVVPCALAEKEWDFNVSNNKFEPHSVYMASIGAPSLKEFAARCILNNRIKYSPDAIPRTLAAELENPMTCRCNKLLIQPQIRQIVNLQSEYGPVNSLNVDYVFCTVACHWRKLRDYYDDKEDDDGEISDDDDDGDNPIDEVNDQ